VAEGIALGLLPLVHTWRGCEQFYPPESLFRTPGECVENVRRYREQNMAATARRFRDEMEPRFSVERQYREIDSVIIPLFSETRAAYQPEQEKPGSSGG
jgi:hypothetical protein